uniref:(California timema) hypothetical protein n=1 Tax=Timema californicum TaxID=61474 RepID=A0A7R9JA93_TIMCA|nr:unnamed protein product [Timema californicum]
MEKLQHGNSEEEFKTLYETALRLVKDVGSTITMPRSTVPQLEKKWLAQKPRCENKMSGFVSVGLVEFYPALHILQYGIMAALAVFLAELVFFHSDLLSSYNVAKVYFWSSLWQWVLPDDSRQFGGSTRQE